MNDYFGISDIGFVRLRAVLNLHFWEMSISQFSNLFPLINNDTFNLSKRDTQLEEFTDIKNAIIDLTNIENFIKKAKKSPKTRRSTRKTRNSANKDAENNSDQSIDQNFLDQDGNHYSTIIMEILISLMTKESKSLRKGAVEGFRQICKELKLDGIEILADAVSGQNVDDEGYGLIVNEEVETDSEEEEEEDEENEEGKGEDNDQDDSDSDNSSSENEDLDEAAQSNLHDKLKAVLGDPTKIQTTDNETDNSNSEEESPIENADSDMDAQMLEMDEKLGQIFRERKNHLGRRQKIELQNQVVNFRLRLLDFIEVLVSSRNHGMAIDASDENKLLSIFLSILSKSLAFCIFREDENSAVFQRCKSLVNLLNKKKINNYAYSQNLYNNDENENNSSKGIYISNAQEITSLLKKVTHKSAASLLISLIFFNIKCLNHSEGKNEENLDEKFNKILLEIFKDALTNDYIKNRNAGFIGFLLNELQNRYSENCGLLGKLLVSEINDNQVCNKSRLIKILKFVLDISKKKVSKEVMDFDQDVFDKLLDFEKNGDDGDNEMEDDGETKDDNADSVVGRGNAEIVMLIAKIARNLKMESILSQIRLKTDGRKEYKKIVAFLKSCT